MDIQHLAARLGKELQRHAPTILTALGVAGVGATAVLANRAGYKSAENIVQHEAYYGESDPLTPRRKLEMIWRNYIPTVSMALATTAFIIASNTISVKRQSALIGAYALSERAISAYRDHAEEQLGKGPETKMREQQAQKEIDANPIEDGLVDIPINKDIFLDKFTGQYFGSDLDTVKDALTEVNRKTLDEGYASMNYFFSLIGARRTDIGEIMGWTEDRMLDIDIFPLKTKDGRDCMVIDYRRQPIMEYHRVW